MTYIIFFSLSWLFNFALFLVLIEMYEFDTYWHVRICNYEAKNCYMEESLPWKLWSKYFDSTEYTLRMPGGE